jgi:hypothetical protein
MVTPDPRQEGYYVSFLYGQVDKSIFGRYDTEEYNYSCSRLENFLINETGGAQRRPGTIYMGEAKTVAGHPKKRLSLFKQTRNNVYVSEFGHQYVRFWNKNSTEKFGKITGTSNNNFEDGTHTIGTLANNGANSARILAGNNTVGWDVRNVFGNLAAQPLAAGATGTITAANNAVDSTTPYELITPYDDDILDEIDIKHFYMYLPDATSTGVSGNSWKIVNLLFHEDHAIRVIYRRGDYAWLEMADNTTGLLEYDRDHAGATIKTIQSVVTTTNNYLSAANQRPSCGEPFNGRMAVCGRNVEPLTIRLSRVDAPDAQETDTTTKSSQMDFGYHDDSEDVTIIAQDAIDLVLPQTRGAQVHWILEYEGLFAGLDDGIVAIESEGGWTAETIPSAKKITAVGTARIIAKVFNNSVYYVMRERKKIRELVFSQEKGGYLSKDLNLLSSHLFEGNVRGFDVQYEPAPTLWVWDDEGYVYALAETGGWSKHWFGYPVESLCVAPGDGEDEVWLCVIKNDVPIILKMAPRRWAHREEAVQSDFSVIFDNGDAVDITDMELDGSDHVVVTSLNSFSDGDIVKITGVLGMTEANNVFAVKDSSSSEFSLARVDDPLVYIDGDGWGTYESGGKARKAQKTLTGLDHLKTENVSVLADGGNYGEVEVESDGTLELETYYSYIIVGSRYRSVLETLPLKNYKNKRIYTYTLFMHDSLGGKVGEDEDHLSTVYPTGRLILDELPELINEPVKRNFQGSHGIKSSLLVVQDYPLPFNLDSIAVEYVQGAS